MTYWNISHMRMTVFTTVLLWTMGFLTLVQLQTTPQPTYPVPAIAVDIDENEPPLPMTVPPIYTGWDFLQPGAHYLTHLFAGRAEFPYVIKIKATAYAPCQDPDDRIYRESSGTLITKDVVMTTARVLSYLHCSEQDMTKIREWPSDDDPLPNPLGFSGTFPIFPSSDRIHKKTLQCPTDKLSVVALDPSILEVRYATVYLYEENKFVDIYGRYSRDYGNLFCGSRHCCLIELHPNYKPWETLEYDIGLLFMTASIEPVGTWVGHPGFPLGENGRIRKTDLSHNEQVCYIAGFNNDYAGMLGDVQITRHYKVKFRAYQERMSTCESFMKIICFDRQVPHLKGCWLWLNRYRYLTDAEKMDAGIECWETRHPRGGVCDIHAGGPLVCGDAMYGFVIRGADWHRCSSRYRMPFFVTRIHPFENFFMAATGLGYLPYNPLLLEPGMEPPIIDESSRSSRQSGIGLSLPLRAFLHATLYTYYTNS